MKKSAIYAIAILAANFLAGCATAPIEQGSIIQTKLADGSTRTENRSDFAAYAEAKRELASKPLFEMTCPSTGCVLASLKVNNPGAGSDLAAPAPPPKVESPLVGFMRELKETVGLLTPIGMAGTVGHAVGGIFAAFADSTEEIADKIQAPQANVTNNIDKSRTTAVTNTNSHNRTENTNSGNTTTTSTTTTNTNNGQNSGTGNTSNNKP